jgi:hypothetical protein
LGTINPDYINPFHQPEMNQPTGGRRHAAEDRELIFKTPLKECEQFIGAVTGDKFSPEEYKREALAVAETIKSILREMKTAPDAKTYTVNGESVACRDMTARLKDIKKAHIDYTVEAVRRLKKPPGSLPDYVRAILCNSFSAVPIWDRIEKNEFMGRV